MKAENKKYLIYGGVAFLVGSLGYFVFTTLKNKKSMVEEKETVVFSEKEPASDTNPFRDMLDNPVIPTKIDYKFSISDFGYNPNRNLSDFGYNPNRNPFTTKSVLL